MKTMKPVTFGTDLTQPKYFAARRKIKLTPAEIEQQRYATVADICTYLSIERETFRKTIKPHLRTVVRLPGSRKVYFLVGELMEYLKGLEVEAHPINLI